MGMVVWDTFSHLGLLIFKWNSALCARWVSDSHQIIDLGSLLNGVVLEVIIEILILLVPTIILIIILRALKHNSKDCEFNLEVNIKGFKISFKTKEENAPSTDKR